MRIQSTNLDLIQTIPCECDWKRSHSGLCIILYSNVLFMSRKKKKKNSIQLRSRRQFPLIIIFLKIFFCLSFWNLTKSHVGGGAHTALRMLWSDTRPHLSLYPFLECQVFFVVLASLILCLLCIETKAKAWSPILKSIIAHFNFN